MTPSTLITSVLEEEVKEKLRNYGIVVWLDKDGHYSRYVDELSDRYQQGDFFAPVIPFRGSYLEMLFALEPYGNGEDPDRLLIHMPGHTEESIRKTPILELYRAGFRYRRALDTLIREAATGKVTPAQIEDYLSQGVVDLPAAEQWLESALAQPQDDLSHYLHNLKPEWVLDGLLTAETTFKDRFDRDATLSVLADYLYRQTGMDQAFQAFYLQDAPLTFTQLSEVFAAWLMSVEYVHDLTRSPHLDELKPLKNLSIPLKRTCDQLINHLRQRHPNLYESNARDVETRLEAELSSISPEDLGKIDTFYREETAVLEGAIQALLLSRWDVACQWSQHRLETNSFWIGRDRPRRLEWTLIRDAATLGSTIQKIGACLESCHTLREAIEAYTQWGYEVDRAHRRFEQQRSKILDTSFPHFNQLRDIGDKLRELYRSWADTLAENFAQICETEGFLPDDDLQQRTLYDQVIHPLTQSDAKVAFFLIDAFRYEMATELIEELEGSGTTVTLKARYAELPTITAVGMNVLAPVSRSGRLTLANKDGFKGFKTGEYTVRTPDDRVKAMGDRSVGSVSNGRRRVRKLTLSDVCDRSTDSLKRGCADADLIVVHSKEIDDAGEANAGLITFEDYLRQLKSAWGHLKSIGVNEFVFTADHGFLLQDQTPQMLKWGTVRDPQRRYALYPHPSHEADKVTVSLNSLGYDGQDGYLLFPRSTAVFVTGNAGATFVHGGNSLQERVIPVLTVSHRYQSALKLTKYLIEAEAKQELLGFSRVQVRVKPASSAQGILSFAGGTKLINLALRVRDRPDITIQIKDAPGATVNNQQVKVELDKDWLEILFDLTGPNDDRVRVEIYHPDALEDVEPAMPVTYFRVSGSRPVEETPPAKASNHADWQDSFADQSICNVFVHIQQHGAITEPELNQMLGTSRNVRRFSLAFEDYLKLVPFSVRIEASTSGKRYVKQN